jgi:uncharacterized protein with GYD domain
MNEDSAFKIQTIVTELGMESLYRVRLEHDYIAYCQSPDEVMFIKLMIELAILYFGLSVLWFYHTFRVHKN